MAKFHINPKGEAGECKAKGGTCPFGGEDKHHSTPEAARDAFEKNMSKEYTLATYIYRKVSDKTADDISSPVKQQMLRDVEAGTNKLHSSLLGKVLSQDSDVKVRLQVAQTIKSQKLLTSMGSDKSKLVREAVASSTHNRELLKKLLTDSEPSVRKAAAANAHSPKKAPKGAGQALAAKALKSAKEERIKEALNVANETLGARKANHEGNDALGAYLSEKKRQRDAERTAN